MCDTHIIISAHDRTTHQKNFFSQIKKYPLLPPPKKKTKKNEKKKKKQNPPPPQKKKKKKKKNQKKTVFGWRFGASVCTGTVIYVGHTCTITFDLVLHFSRDSQKEN